MERLKVLVTAGSTVVPIDQVRVISNIFKGKTGTAIAKHLLQSGADVTLLTSNPSLVGEMQLQFAGPGLQLVTYRTYDELAAQMKKLIGGRVRPDVVIHSAAVSDYKVDGVHRKVAHGKLVSVYAAEKVSSRYKELYLRLIPTAKLVDKIRTEWRFKGILVKFKLEVGIGDEVLLTIAKRSQLFSGADLMVANCLEWSGQRAYILGPGGKPVERVSRRRLPEALLEKVLELSGKEKL